jgi:hypothetical protein
MIFNEALEQRQQYEEGLLRKWDKALNADGGIQNEHMAKTTAILLENYMQHLQSNPSLIAEERIATNNFKGVNLALLGLIRRAIPTLVGAELVGVQAMPTPQSPIFYMAYKKNKQKGNSVANSELFGYPGTLPPVGDYLGNDVFTGSGAINEGDDIDPYFSSSKIRYVSLPKDSTPAAGEVITGTSLWGPALNGTVTFLAFDANKNIVGRVNIPAGPGGYTRTGNADNVAANVTLGNDYFGDTASDTKFSQTFNGSNGIFTLVFSTKLGDTIASSYAVAYEYSQESNTEIPELEMQILQYTISLIRRQLRGRFSLDAAVDAKAYHGISLENELMEMMKLQLTNEINREIVSDLRKMARISKTITYNQTADGISVDNISGNYDDTHRFILDAINGLSAEIYNQTRVGRGNFVIGNPVTLAFLDRVPGFVGSGVDMTSGGLSYAGKQGGRMSFYFDPQYKKGELLIGYKGASALDCGYIHAPYLPITSTPTLYNQETGDPSKIFYTRYGKTFKDVGDDGKQSNAIYRGEYFYAKLTLASFPSMTSTIS